jgi:Ser/Thr protein kinase RdoA (MazF antagonist)
MVDRRITVYLSGPMTGKPAFNYPAFHAAARHLRAKGYFVLNPAESFDGDTSRPRSDYMRKDIEMLLQADVVALLPGWEKSRGVAVEVAIATELGLILHPMEEMAF